jgi:streptothricin hydrolase
MCVSATARSALARGFDVVLITDTPGTYDLGDIAHEVVSRMAEHALGDQLLVAATNEIIFSATP